MIEIKNLCLKYIREYYALYNIDLNIERGESVAFVGEEQSGRTTLLRVIAGLEKYDSGEVYIDGRAIEKIDFKCDVDLGYVPVMPVFFENKTVFENLKYVLAQRKIERSEIEARIDKALINFNLEKYKNIKAGDLDLYERYMVSFVRLTLRNIDYLLVDDIFEKLQPDEASAFVKLIDDVFIKKGVTVIAVSGNYDILRPICPRLIQFDHGSIIESDK